MMVVYNDSIMKIILNYAHTMQSSDGKTFSETRELARQRKQNKRAGQTTSMQLF